jgi:hypothetical protein
MTEKIMDGFKKNIPGWIQILILVGAILVGIGELKARADEVVELKARVTVLEKEYYGIAQQSAILSAKVDLILQRIDRIQLLLEKHISTK